METLISMTDFVLNQREKVWDDKNFQLGDFYKSVANYAKFLKQPLTLGMFVPCDENGEIMDLKGIKQSVIEGTDSWDAYEEAKERVLFEGFENVDTRCNERKQFKLKTTYIVNAGDIIEKDLVGFFFYDSRNEKSRLHTIEDLLNFHPIELTETAKNQIGL